MRTCMSTVGSDVEVREPTRTILNHTIPSSVVEMQYAAPLASARAGATYLRQATATDRTRSSAKQLLSFTRQTMSCGHTTNV
jgi:hypothetical protein